MKVNPINLNRSQAALNKVKEVTEFLERNYEIRVNRFDPNPNKAYLRCKTRKLEHGVTVDDISLHMIEEGLNVSDTVLRKILKSPNYMRTYDPITDYFDSIRGKYEGNSHIDWLCAHIRVKEYPGLGRGYYHQRMARYLKKWMVATVANALGKRTNDVALGLIHADEGIGKSFMFDFLTPEPLKKYFINAKNDTQKFDLETAFVTNFLILFDELVGINKKNSEEFKTIMSQREIEVRLPREYFPIRMPRIASACFTSNNTPEKGGFITPSMGYRRWLVIELDSINKDYAKKCNVDQMWAEALMLCEETSYDYAWGDDDFNEFRTVNERYNLETPSMKYIKMYYAPAQNGEGTWMQPQELLQQLITRRCISSDDRGKVNAVEVGRALKQLGYQHEKRYRGQEDKVYCYNVKTIESLEFNV